ncbi:WD repeat-containing protein 86-like [Argiope bruennichi]|uniref:WD repeat-containing protein 86-like n=1 Tax=Argiope bruennichi TaxID=94029 RepID=UPI002495126B|nr:WD repeat-containing protein 86-like [Argiope bruennichi]
MGLDASKDINPNAARGYILEKFTRHKGGMNCMVMEPEKYLMATGGEDRTVVLWRINTTPTQSKATLKGHSDYVSCLAFHEKFVLSGSADCTIRKWCLTTHECLFVFEGHTGRINRILSAGDFMFTSSVDHTARAWTLITQKYEAMEDVCLKVFEGHSKAVYPLVFIPDDESSLDGKTMSEKDLFITGSSDKTIRIWSLKTGKTLQTLKGHKGTVNALVVDPEGKMLFSGGGDGIICCWNIATGECIRQMTGHESAILSLISHNKMLYSCSTDKTARAWIMDFGECIKVYRDHTHSVTCIKYLDGYVFTGCADTYSRMFKAKTGECKRVFKGHTKAIVQLEPVYDKLYTVSVDGTLRVWDTTGILEDDPEEINKQLSSA